MKKFKIATLGYRRNQTELDAYQTQHESFAFSTAGDEEKAVEENTLFGLLGKMM